jgi:hypothetical protein
MKFPFCRFLPLGLALFALPVVLCSAAESPKADDQGQTPWIFNVDFPGGSLDQLIKSISSANAAIFNVVGEKADLATTIPGFSLRNADSESLANALNQLIAPRGLNISRAQGPSFVGPRGPASGPANSSIYVLSRRSAIDRPAFDSFQLAPFLEKQTIDDIVTAIRTLWELNPANRPEALQLKFHPPTKLLLVSGTPEAIAVASKVISRLEGAPGAPGTIVTHSAPPTPTEEQRRIEAAAAAAEAARRRANTPKQ